MAKKSKQRPMKANSNNFHNWQNSIKVKGPKPYIHTSHFKLVWLQYNVDKWTTTRKTSYMIKSIPVKKKTYTHMTMYIIIQEPHYKKRSLHINENDM